MENEKERNEETTETQIKETNNFDLNLNVARVFEVFFFIDGILYIYMIAIQKQTHLHAFLNRNGCYSFFVLIKIKEICITANYVPIRSCSKYVLSYRIVYENV